MQCLFLSLVDLLLEKYHVLRDAIVTIVVRLRVLVPRDGDDERIATYDALHHDIPHLSPYLFLQWWQ